MHPEFASSCFCRVGDCSVCLSHWIVPLMAGLHGDPVKEFACTYWELNPRHKDLEAEVLSTRLAWIIQLCQIMVQLPLFRLPGGSRELSAALDGFRGLPGAAAAAAAAAALGSPKSRRKSPGAPEAPEAPGRLGSRGSRQKPSGAPGAAESPREPSGAPAFFTSHIFFPI